MQTVIALRFLSVVGSREPVVLGWIPRGTTYLAPPKGQPVAADVLLTQELPKKCGINKAQVITIIIFEMCDVCKGEGTVLLNNII